MSPIAPLRRSRRWLGALILGASLMTALSGCVILETAKLQSQPADYGTLVEAIPEAEPRVVEVAELNRFLSGFSYVLSVSLVTDTADPFTPEQLDTVASTIWQSLPWEPVNITLDASTAAGEIVELPTEIDSLDPLSANDFGQGGVILSGMARRYGDWTPPG